MKKIILGLIVLGVLFSFQPNAYSADQYVTFRNQQTGEVCLYLSALNWVGQNKQCYPVPDWNWEIVSTQYDFNGDGQYDILWRCKSINQFYVWVMNGLTIVDFRPVLEPMGPEWVIK